MLGPVDRAIQIVIFATAAWVFWYGLVPLTLGTFEWLFDVGGSRTGR